MASKTTVGLVALAFLFLLSGLAARNFMLVALVIPIVLLVFLSSLPFTRERVDVKASWTSDDRELLEGEELCSKLVLENAGRHAVYAMVATDLPEQVELVQGRTRFPIVLRPGSSIGLEFKLRFPRRGRYDLGNVRLEVSRTILSMTDELVVDCHLNVKVLPFVYPLDRSPFRPRHVRLPSGNVISSLLGPGLEFHSLREYVPGDEQRFINWKATARSDQVIVNDYQSERSGDVVIVVDARSSVKGRIRSDRLIDKESDAAASLAALYLRQRDRVGMMVLGDFIDVVRPAYGRRQFEMIVDRLLGIKRGWSRSSTALGKVVQRHFPSNSLILLISPLDDPGLVNAIRVLAAHGHTMAVLSPYEAELVSDDNKAQELHSRLKRLKRVDELYLVSRYSQVVDWNIDDPLPMVLQEVRR